MQVLSYLLCKTISGTNVFIDIIRSMDTFEIVFYTVIAIYLAGSVFYGFYRGVYLRIVSKNTPILFLYYTQKGRFVPIHKVKKDDLTIFIYSSFKIDGGNKSATMFSVHLPFKTNIHLLGITKRTDMSQFRIETVNSVMEPVLLEGDYGKYFTLYTEKNTQMEARYVLDPKAMVFTIDFCKSHSWEIRGSEFYFVQENVPNLEGDDTTMWNDIEQFIKEIRPAVTVPLSDKELRIRNPYGSAVQHQDKITCPNCSTKLVETTDEVYECPNGHGCLLHGSDLVKFRKKKLELKLTKENISSTDHKQIKCPSCGSEMEKVSYAMTPTIIDSCNNCQFRWLDSGELAN
jgi:Zn-finger nucleic acid-binding protein